MKTFFKAYSSSNYSKVWEKKKDKQAPDVYLSETSGILEIHAYSIWEEKWAFCYQ